MDSFSERFNAIDRVVRSNVKEVGTQTEPKKAKYEPDHIKEIERITGHDIGGKRMGVRFDVKFKGYKINYPMRHGEIKEIRGGFRALRHYLIVFQNNKEKSRSFKSMMKNDPSLEQYLKED